MNRWSALALLLAVAGALALRGPRLDIRPLHNDEAVNAVKLSALWEKGVYTYDLHEFHGPALSYAALPFLWLSSTRDPDQLGAGTMRLVPVAFGTGLILLLLLLADGLGRLATVWAAIFTAVSPAMVFYSRYFIHEMLLVFFTLLALAAGWRYHQTRGLPWAVLAGVGLGLMYATKETFVFSVAAMGLAAMATVWWNQWRTQRSALVAGGQTGGRVSPFSLRPLAAACNGRHVALVLIVAVLVSHLLFSSFFMNLAGPIDSLRTYLPWLRRAGGHSPHIHPWYFYLERLAWFHQPKGPVWSEALILALAAVGAVVAFFSNRTILANSAFARFLAFYTAILTAIYTLISYKTPWCALSFLHGMILLAGLGAAALFRLCRSLPTRALLAAALVAGTSHLAWEAWQASQTYASDRKNPYVYAQTSPDLARLVDRVEAIARVAPLGHETLVKVISPESYWPLPWYLRKFKHVGWWDELPPDPYAPIIIVSAKLRAALDEKSNRAYLMAGLYELRPGTFLELYVEIGLWKKFVATLPRERE
jgi:uncharacterized protein (TIGR03663 family)